MFDRRYATAMGKLPSNRQECRIPDLVKAFEQRLDAKLTNKAVATFTKGKHPMRWDHLSVFDGEEMQFIVNQPYLARPGGVPHDMAEHQAFALSIGWDGAFYLPSRLGCWNPPSCDVIIYHRIKPVRKAR